MSFFGWLIATWSLLAAGFTLAALLRLRRTPPPPGPTVWPPLLLLRPVDAPTSQELANLVEEISYPGLLEQVVLSPFRVEVAQGRWLHSDPPTPNRKVGHLAYALAALPLEGRCVLSIDADVRVDAELLAALSRPLLAGASLVSAAPAPRRGVGGGALLTRALLGCTHHHFAALDALRWGPASVCGKALALGPLAQAMLPELSDRIGEDLELSHRLHRAKAAVVLAEAPAQVPQDRQVPAAERVQRFTRWMQVLRAHRPGLYPSVPLLFCPSLPILFLALLSGQPGAWGAVAALFLVRTLLALRLLAWSGQGRDAWLWPLGEAVLLLAFVRSLGARAVSWRGRRFALRAGGKMEPLL